MLFALFALLAAAALCSRFLLIGRKSVWLDEAVSWRFANVSLQTMFDFIARDKHPPLYYGVLHFWVNVFGNSEAALRAPSAIAGAATVVLLAAIGWRVGGRLLGLSAGLLLLLNSAHLGASQEARMYALAGFLALAASGVLAAYIAKPAVPRFLAYAVLMTALIYTHYSGMFVVGAHGLVFGAYGLHELATKRRAWILAGGLATLAFLGLAYVPWLSTFRAHLAAGAPYEIPKPSVTNVSVAGRSLLGLDVAKGFWLIFCLPLLGFGIVAVARRWREPVVVAVSAIALVPAVQILNSIWFDPIFNVRQAAPYTPGLVFIMALGLMEVVSLARRWQGLSRPGYAAVAVFGVVMLALMTVRVERTLTGPSRQDWRGVAAELKGNGQPIYIAPGFEWQSLAYYRKTELGVTPLWAKDLNRIVKGADPVTADRTHAHAILIVQSGNADVVLPAFKRFVDVEGRKQYAGRITTYSLHPLLESR